MVVEVAVGLGAIGMVGFPHCWLLLSLSAHNSSSTIDLALLLVIVPTASMSTMSFLLRQRAVYPGHVVSDGLPYSFKWKRVGPSCQCFLSSIHSSHDVVVWMIERHPYALLYFTNNQPANI